MLESISTFPWLGTTGTLVGKMSHNSRCGIICYILDKTEVVPGCKFYRTLECSKGMGQILQIACKKNSNPFLIEMHFGISKHELGLLSGTPYVMQVDGCRSTL